MPYFGITFLAIHRYKQDEAKPENQSWNCNACIEIVKNIHRIQKRKIWQIRSWMSSIICRHTTLINHQKRHLKWQILSEWSTSYVHSKFGFLNYIANCCSKGLGKSLPCLGIELVQFVYLIDLYKNDHEKKQSKKLFYYHSLENQNFRSTFPNIESTLRMYLILIKLLWRAHIFKLKNINMF